MPVSVVCESTANVNAALRESLGSSYSAAGVGGDDGKAAGGTSSMATGTAEDCLQSKLVASAKRVLLSKIDYEEVSNYSQSVLDSLKSKYIVLKPSSAAVTNGNGSVENGRASPAATCSGSANNGNSSGNNNGFSGNNNSADANGNRSNGGSCNNAMLGNGSAKRPNNPNELPQPKRILYPRENVRIGWKSTSRKWQVGVGMMNVGNTCYLNSTLQALFHVPSMANWLMNDTQHMEQCDSADAGCIICAMAKTLQASQTGQSAIRPYYVYSKLKSICKHLVMGRQEDAHEFLRYLVEAMEKSYLSRYRNYKDLDQHTKETTPLNQILGGYLKSAVRCLSCGHVSVTFQHFQDLLLDIRKADTVEEALEGYFSRERLEDMGYKCESCKKKVSATKQFSLERAPIALCIQLKRFSMLGTKLNKQITIKPRLDLSKFVSRKTPGEQLTYKLVAMVTHLGASQHCGHYTAIGLTESGTYYNYDDSYVRPISVQNVCSTNAYIIFYEMDNAPPRQVTSTQVSSGASCDTKENYQKTNGYCTSPQQRIIGPQLPPAYASTLNVNKAMAATTNGTPYSNGSKLSINRQSSIPTSSNNNNSSSKIMIHFKNNNNASAKSSASSSISSATATSSSSQNNGHNGGVPSNTQQNGLLTGTGKFQESAHTRYPLVGTSNKGQAAAAANGHESSFTCISSVAYNHQDEMVSSSTTARAKSMLPSMPKLCDSSATPAAVVSTTPTKKSTPNALPALKSPLRSLVPYESETDDETSTSAEPKRVKCTTSDADGRSAHKRRSSSSTSSSDDGSNDDDANAKPSNGLKVKKAATSSNTPSHNAINGTASQSKANSNNKHTKTDAIDEIFNVNKRNANSYSNNNGTHNPPTKKQQQKSQQFAVSSTTPATDSDDDAGADSNDESNSTRPPFKRSHSTPPSPPVIKTKTGLWQVTTLQPVTACVSPSEQRATPTTTTPSKNPKNPFAAKGPNELFVKRPKFTEKSAEKRTFVGNGYQRDTANDSVVNELQKHSHRGYGAPVLSWNGNQTEIDKEIAEEAREQRQRDWEEEEENEMDRGRQKKVKPYKEPTQQHNRAPGYNPFQEQQENLRRWKHGGSHRFYGGHFRHQFQRNKFKFQRFNPKFQRSTTAHHQRQNGGGGGGYNRRDS